LRGHINGEQTQFVPKEAGPVTEKNVYEELAEMIDKEDVVGMPPTPSFLKLLSLQFAPEEAALALQTHLSGGTLDELASRTGIGKTKLKDILLTMADKGTIVYDPAEEDPVYKVAGMTAGGLTETGMWGGIRFPFTVQLGIAMYTMLKEHAELSLAKLGFGYTPVWAAQVALPKDALPTEDLCEAIKGAGHWSVSTCPCRLARALVEPSNPCKHMPHTCVHTGALSRWAVKHSMARELTYDQTLHLLRECNEDGLVHTINIYGQICNCCRDCCAIFHSFKLGAPTFAPSPFTAQSDQETCNACGACADRCPVGAIQVDDHAVVDSAICIGCGVCIPTCKQKSMKLTRRPVAQQTAAMS
jgi:NAD-dependent dihydropyrimidine dehydrogenase PreA subunit